ncbi:secretogranin-1 isoform X1 [Chiloscyllium plagiosum]|uniref:secretogranin-1 isoform X1 n=1 Tax=Chiloscyllium plagiosum TaxID=36176 RepID=UPI001CB7F4EC|nr:secretogranin-1 isoform X1 [Chiloscyllium plagiosum]
MQLPSLLTLSVLSAVTAVARSLPVERGTQKDELVTRCIIEALSTALAKANAPPVSSECRTVLDSGKHEVARKKNTEENQHYEDERHVQESEKHHYEDKGSQEAEGRYGGEQFEADDRGKDESEEQKHFKQANDEERNSEDDSRRVEDFKPVKSPYEVKGHRNHHTGQKYHSYEERRHADGQSADDEEEKHRKRRHSDEDSGQEQNSPPKTDDSELASHGFHEKWPHGYDKGSEESFEEDKAIGLGGQSDKRRHSTGERDSDQEMDGSEEDLNDQDKRNGNYGHEAESEESEENDNEKRVKLLNGHIYYHKRNSYSHSDEDRKSSQQGEKNADKSEETSKELEHIKSIQNYLKGNNIQEAYEKGKHHYEDIVDGHMRSNSEESVEEEQYHGKRTHSEEKVQSSEKKHHSREEEKRHYDGNKRHSEEEKPGEDAENEHHGQEKRHYSEEEKRHIHNEKWLQTDEGVEEKFANNEEDEDIERNTKHFPRMQQVWWQKKHSMEDRTPDREEKMKPREKSYFYPEYEGYDGKLEKRHEKRYEDEDQGQEVEDSEGHASRQHFAHDLQEKMMYDRMDKLAQYLKAKKKSFEVPELYDFEENEKQHHEDRKRNMNHRTLTKEEEKELENLAAMDLELEKMAEKLHGSQRN